MTVVVRESKETNIRVAITAGTGVATVATGDVFLDHMLVAFARYAGVDLEVQATGDMRHHLIEDVAITLGQAVAAFAPSGCARYGERTVPMDDALVQVVLDIGGRPYYEGKLPSNLYEHFLRSFADNAKATLPSVDAVESNNIPGIIGTYFLRSGMVYGGMYLAGIRTNLLRTALAGTGMVEASILVWNDIKNG